MGFVMLLLFTLSVHAGRASPSSLMSNPSNRHISRYGGQWPATHAHHSFITCVHEVQVDGSGQVLDFLMDGVGAHVSSVSAVSESPDGKLWLGNLVGSYVSYVDLVTLPWC